VRGRWGEMTLRRLVELAGMAEHCDFTEQLHVAGEEGAQRPDMVTGRTAESAVTGDPTHYIDSTAFQLQPPGTYGNSGRNILEGPQRELACAECRRSS